MEYQFNVTLSEKILRKAVLHYWMRLIGWELLIIAGVLGALAFSFSDSEYGRQLLILFFGFGFLAFIAGLVYFSHRHRSLSLYRVMASKEVRYRFTEESIMAESSIGTSTLKWNAIRKIWKFPDVWLFFYYSGSFSTFPTATMSPELAAFLEKQVKAHGGKVK